MYISFFCKMSIYFTTNEIRVSLKCTKHQHYSEVLAAPLDYRATRSPLAPCPSFLSPFILLQFLFFFLPSSYPTRSPVFPSLSFFLTPFPLPPATAAAVVQSRLHEPRSVYYFASFYVRQQFQLALCPRRTISWRRHC